jgi:hypothetical protein
MHARKERIESFEKLSRERKINRKSMFMWMKEEKKDEVAIKIWEDGSSERKEK